MNQIILTITVFFSSFLIFSCGGKDEAEESDRDLWVGKWMMTGYDKTGVDHRDTLIFMDLNADFSIVYLTQTRNGTILSRVEGEYKLNDQHSMISVYENNELMSEYFIRKLDQDSLIFQSDTFSIQWKRVQ